MSRLNAKPDFIAAFFGVSEEDGVYTLGITNNPENPVHYVIIQYSKDADEQDTALGHEREYFESSFIDGGDYGIVKSIAVYDDQMAIRLESQDDSKTIVIDIQNCTKSSDDIFQSLLTLHQSTKSGIKPTRD